MMMDQHVGAGLPEELFRGLQDALEQGSSASKQVLRVVLDAVKENLSGQAAVVLTPADDESLQFFQATEERLLADDIPNVPIASSIAGFVYLSGQTIALDNARESSRHYAEIDEKSGFVTAEYLAVPIVHEDSVLGVLTVANRSGTESGPFPPSAIDLAAVYADLCALLLNYETNLGRQIAATSEELRHFFFASDGTASDVGFGGAPSLERATDQLRARLNSTLRELQHSDLELVHDLAARLAETSAVNKT